ncbi:hypothetical protein LZZ90_02445 [Flavobacterium sp. SM15]|uniref:hypothetical protein n=1 Tax=Flavobacterium sp. SM15 TaxID=2908005 RepID=UPI001EDBB22C|nr:hypothetical protein [Flavobacterium sp. SM15]MCG2610365.1 hypothetical protein [Flavobacterium sp. SM15]
MTKRFPYTFNYKKFLPFLVLVLGFFLGVSCQRKQVKNDASFKTTISLKCSKNNSIQIFYKTVTDDRYYEEFSLRENISASQSLQDLVFEFPQGVKPRNLRIDLGENENENDSVKVQGITFQYKDRLLDGSRGNYKSWFEFNPNVVAGKDSLTYHLIRKNNTFDPQLNGNRKLNAKLVKLFPPDIYEN